MSFSHETIERFNTYKAEVEAQGRRFDPMDVGVCRAFYVAKDAADKARAVEARLANQQRMTRLATDPGATVKSSMLSFDHTLDAAADPLRRLPAPVLEHETRHPEEEDRHGEGDQQVPEDDLPGGETVEGLSCLLHPQEDRHQ